VFIVPSPTTIPTGGVKRLSPSKRDPRLEKRVRLDQPSFSWNGTLYNGDQSVCQINIQTLKNKFLVTQLK
jgi:hypothetical protein